MKKKILTAAILAAFALSLAACGAGQSTPAPGSSSTSTGPQVDLQTFYDATVAKHDFGPMHQADADLIDTQYNGLNDISVTQLLVYTPEARQNSGDFFSPLFSERAGNFFQTKPSNRKDQPERRSKNEEEEPHHRGHSRGPHHFPHWLRGQAQRARSRR